MFRSLIILLAIAIADADQETQMRLGIVTGNLVATELAPEVAGFATVLDPAPLIALLRQEQTAAKNVEFSKKSLARAEQLFSEGNLIPQKLVDAARAQLLSDEATRQSLADSICATYGKISNSTKYVEQLLAAEKILLRISTHTDLEAEPISVEIASKLALTATDLKRAPVADPVFQNISWFALAEGENLLPGMTFPARLMLPGDSEKGYLLPSAAIVWHAGIPWAYHEIVEGKFERVRVPEGKKIKGGQLISATDFPVTGIVITGAALLLSGETMQDN